MKKLIIPLVGLVGFVLLAYLVNPKVEPVGIIMIAMLGLGIGAVLNQLIFRKKGTDKEVIEENENANAK